MEDRTQNFAQKTKHFVLKLHKNLINYGGGRQLIRSSGSMGANYVKAVETLSKKDFFMKAKICRKEAKETLYSFKLHILEMPELDTERTILL